VKVLILCSGNAPVGEQFDLKIHQAFIHEQVESLKLLGVEFNYYFIKDKGSNGYLKHYLLLKRELQNKYDLIHAHNGLCGFIANLQKRVPVITTFHGSDINLLSLRMISYFPLIQSTQSIFVSESQLKKVFIKSKVQVIPCAVDINVFYPKDNTKVNTSNNPIKTKKQILFASSFSISIKNYPLALSAIKKLNNENIELIELKGKSREEVCNLMNTSELLLLTSFSEGSPQVIKEAMACNCPIVSTDVGDISEVIGSTEGCYICSFDSGDVAAKIKEALLFSEKIGRTNGRARIINLGLDSISIAKRVLEVYKKVVFSD
jgi:teichuronic acid biosynthesis glycosyltransferase TuaC